MIKYDYHMHTNYSNDSDAPMEEVIQRAIELDLHEITITDHYDYIYPKKHFPYQIDYDLYLVEFNQLKEKYKDKIQVNLGIEVGLSPYLDDEFTKIAKKYDFDFIIGSVHDIKGEDLYFGNFFIPNKKEFCYNTYFNYLLESIKKIDELCVIGHLDFISRYGPYEDPSVHYVDYKEGIDAVLVELINRGKGLEINTSGFRYGINNVYPNVEILKRFKQLGGEILTIGSDAHKPKDIARDFDFAYKVAKEAGFEYITTFRKLKPTFIKF